VTALGRPIIALTELGKCLDKTIQTANKGNVNIDKYVIMPNHAHLIVVLRCVDNDASEQATGNRGRSPLQQVVRNIKSYVTKQAGYPV